MGTPDTIHLDPPVKCTICGTLINAFQTYLFADFMYNYRIGDILEGSTVTGVVRDDIHCPNYAGHPTPKEDKPQWVYLGLWHHILICIEETHDAAFEKVTKFGLGELYLLHEEKQVQRNHYRDLYYELKNLIHEYADFLELSAEEQKKIKTGSDKQAKLFFWNLDECLEAPSPLQFILNKFKDIPDEADPFFL